MPNQKLTVLKELMLIKEALYEAPKGLRDCVIGLFSLRERVKTKKHHFKRFGRKGASD